MVAAEAVAGVVDLLSVDAEDEKSNLNEKTSSFFASEAVKEESLEGDPTDTNEVVEDSAAEDDCDFFSSSACLDCSGLVKENENGASVDFFAAAAAAGSDFSEKVSLNESAGFKSFASTDDLDSVVTGLDSTAGAVISKGGLLNENVDVVSLESEAAGLDSFAEDEIETNGLDSSDTAGLAALASVAGKANENVGLLGSLDSVEPREDENDGLDSATGAKENVGLDSAAGVNENVGLDSATGVNENAGLGSASVALDSAAGVKENAGFDVLVETLVTGDDDGLESVGAVNEKGLMGFSSAVGVVKVNGLASFCSVGLITSPCPLEAVNEMADLANVSGCLPSFDSVKNDKADGLEV